MGDRDPLVDVEAAREYLRVPLTGQEKERWADKLADVDQRLRAKVSEAKQVAAGFKSEIDKLKEASAELAEEVRLGESRLVTVETTRDYREGTVVKVRTDSGEILSERSMTTDERQMRFEQLKRREENRQEAAEQVDGAVQGDLDEVAEELRQKRDSAEDDGDDGELS